MRLKIALHALGMVLLTGFACAPAQAEDGSAAWLRYAALSQAHRYDELPSTIVEEAPDAVRNAAAHELQLGLSSMLGRQFAVSTAPVSGPAIVLATTHASPSARFSSADDSFRIEHSGAAYRIVSATSRGELYGAFHLLERIASEQPLVDEQQTPAAPIRWTDEWDNLNGTIERGYAGPSIFFENGHVRSDLTRAAAYARLLSSVGINGCNVNNVNADLDLLTPEHIAEFARLAAAFRPWGVRLALSIDLTSPQTVGHLASFDPKDPAVMRWWQQTVDAIYQQIPDFGGFTVKADSEGRKGPSQYGRSPADAANVLARALAPHGGVVLYRGFVYNNHLDWHDPKADRARAGVDNFARYDGQFEPNVIIQIKEGPIDFQAREPVSPLFARLPHTAMAIEVQTSQEYTGQQRHIVWLPSMWQWVLQTDMHAPTLQGQPRSTPVAEIVEGRAFPQADGTPRLGGFVSVTNVGMEPNWLHHPMAMANLYGFGKLAWNPRAPLEGIIDTWTRLTWGNDPQVDHTIDAMQRASWRVYEGYTGPNGMGTLTNILGYHFGPGIASAERNGWGQWFRGEKDGIGMERTAAGTGFIQQYPPVLAAEYESLKTCPDDLLLFFHHVAYNYRLHNGKTLVQSIYDTHYANALEAAEYVPQWQSLQGKVDPERYAQTLALLQFQAGHALVWRDAIDDWFHSISGIADAKGRVGHHPGRLEAESLPAQGYTAVSVDPAETASGGRAVVCHDAEGCTLTTTITQPQGRYDIAVGYYDVWRGASRYELLVNGQPVAKWSAADHLPPAQFDPHLDGQDATRYTAYGIALAPGDTLQLRGIPDLRPELDMAAPVAAAPGAIDPHTAQHHDYREAAPVDYIVIGPDGPITPQA